MPSYNDLHRNALKQQRANLAGEVDGAAKRLRDIHSYQQRGDYCLGSPAALQRAKDRHATAVADLEAFDKQHRML